MDIRRKPHLSDAHIKLLEKAHSNGLVSTSEKFLAGYLDLSQKTGLTVVQLKVWVNNHKRRDRKRPPPDDDYHPNDHDSCQETSRASLNTAGRPRGTRKITGHKCFVHRCGVVVWRIFM